jgi:hypothetical protein
LESNAISVEVRKTNEELLDTEKDKTDQPDKLLDVCSDMAPDKSGKGKTSSEKKNKVFPT